MLSSNLDAPYLGIQSVTHQLEFTIGRDEGNGAIGLELRKTNALMKLNVLELNSLVAT